MTDGNASIYRLKGVIRNYEWGGREFLSHLLGYPNPQNQPMAEYWLGAHDMDASILLTDGDVIKLNTFIASDKERTLGKTVAKKFGRLPYLLKLLDVRDMLSIQVHPAKHEAETEFARENREGIPLNAPHRNYKDDNHKPEFIVALSEFWLLHGFKPVEKLVATLQPVPELEQLLEIFKSTGYDQLYKTVMEMPQQSVNEILRPLLDRIIPLYQKDQLNKDQEDFWAARAALLFNRQNKIDRGIFSIYFFNLLCLNKGEGIFQNAGIPHAYLEGQNVEIMANSDNVLRGGLTHKHIDVKELMKHVKFEETVPGIIYPQKINGYEELYRTVAPDFRLSLFSLPKNETSSFESTSGEILLVVDGTILLHSGGDQFELTRGEAAFVVSHQQVSLTSKAGAELFRAGVPVHIGE